MRPSGTRCFDVWFEGVGEPGSDSSRRSTAEESGDKWTGEESIANGSSDICGGLGDEEIESDTVDEFWVSTTTLVEDRLLRTSHIGGGLSGSCALEDAEG